MQSVFYIYNLIRNDLVGDKLNGVEFKSNSVEFMLYKHDGRHRTYKRSVERFKHACIEEKVAYCGRSVLAWPGISSESRTELVFIENGSLTRVRAPVQKPATVISSKFVSEFNTFYPKLLDNVLDQIKYLEDEEVRKRIKSVAEEYPLVKIAKQGEFLVFVYELLEKPENINERKIHQAYVLGALQEIVQAYFLIADDVLDQSETRNLKKCWYLLPEVSNLAMNDISLFRSFTFEMLKQNIDDEFYLKVMDCTEKMFLIMEIAQHLNAITKDFKDFKIDVYNRTQINKASKYALVSPINLALILSNKDNEKSFQLVEDLCNDLGVMVQINNDFTEYLDYRRKFTIKSGTDIKKRICSWSAVTALQHFNAEQRKIFEENYGKWDSECEKRIVKLYDEVNLEKLYIIERESRYRRFLKKVEKLPNDSVPSPQVFRKILEFFRSYSDDLNKYYFV